MIKCKWAIGMLILKGEGSIDKEANKGYIVDGDLVIGVSLNRVLIIGASPNGLDLSNGSATTSICTL